MLCMCTLGGSVWQDGSLPVCVLACRLAHKHNWAAQRVAIGDTDALPYDYGQLLARSVFCAAATGDGWATRIEDAIQHGCIPVIFHDGVHGPFESILEYDAFTLRLKESAVDEHLPKVGGPQQTHGPGRTGRMLVTPDGRQCMGQGEPM